MGAHTAPRTGTTGRLAGRGALTVATALALTGGTASFAFAGVGADSTAKTTSDCDSTCGEKQHEEVEAASTECEDSCSDDARSEEDDCDEDGHEGRHASWDDDDDDDDDDDHHGRWSDDDDDEHGEYREGFRDGYRIGYKDGAETKEPGLPALDDILGGGASMNPAA